MPSMEATAMRVLDGTAVRSPSQLQDAYELFRLERQGNLVTPRTLEFYDLRIGEFFAWLGRDAPGVERIDGKLLQPETLHASHRAVHTFFAWAERDGYLVDGRLLRLPPPRKVRKEATLYHLTQLRAILGACRRPEETLAVRILVGSGVRISELSGLAVRGPDGLPDLMLDSLERGRAELRVRWDAGAKGRKARRVPITPQLALAVKRYVARDRPRVEAEALLVSAYGRAYRKWGLDAMMDRLEERVGSRTCACGDGPRRLQRVAALRVHERGARPGTEERLGRVRCHAVRLLLERQHRGGIKLECADDSVHRAKRRVAPAIEHIAERGPVDMRSRCELLVRQVRDDASALDLAAVQGPSHPSPPRWRRKRNPLSLWFPLRLDRELNLQPRRCTSSSCGHTYSRATHGFRCNDSTGPALTFC
ncbi:MAG: hypothetical protein E6J45_11630 [Chloroflexi bacterium]|nr:MAG: hypothetical protein E6J45_11630 [Chloroflexota bacterium]